jgi:hypothetical protein
MLLHLEGKQLTKIMFSLLWECKFAPLIGNGLPVGMQFFKGIILEIVGG